VVGALQDKVVIVTGAASGIGKASAILFARNGSKVVVSDIDTAGGEATVQEITSGGGTAIFVKTNVALASDARKCVEATIEKFGKLDCLFSNAGINPVGTVTETTEELWDKILDTNLKSAYLMCKYSIPEMKKAGKGSIVCTASVDGVLAIPNEAAYIASKGGLISLVKALAVDYGKENIRVNCILPGAIRTPLYEKFAQESRVFDDAEGDPQADQHALGRIGEPVEIAQVAMFLLSDTPTFVTGAIIPVDGGYSAVKI